MRGWLDGWMAGWLGIGPKEIRRLVRALLAWITTILSYLDIRKQINNHFCTVEIESARKRGKRDLLIAWMHGCMAVREILFYSFYKGCYKK